MNMLVIAIWFLAGLISLSLACEGQNKTVKTLGECACGIWAAVSAAILIYGGLIIVGIV